MEVWPENWQTFLLFESLRTQWRTGINGATGLDYNVLYHKLDRMKLSSAEYEQIENDIGVLERSALSAMHQKD